MESDSAIVVPFLMQVRRYQTIQITESPLAKLYFLKQQLSQLILPSRQKECKNKKVISVQKIKCFCVARYAVELGKKGIRWTFQRETAPDGADLDGFILWQSGDRRVAQGYRVWQKRGSQSEEGKGNICILADIEYLILT